MTSRLIRTQICFILSAIFVFTLCHETAGQNLVNVNPAGVDIDANGVLRTKTFRDPTGQLTRQRFLAAQSILDADLIKPSELRKISLNRLERVIADRLASGEELDDSIRYLAGLTQITNVFYYPDTKDIVVAGPAEGFYTDMAGRVVGMKTGKAIMRLEDLIVALRAFSPDNPSTPYIGCSIDPTQEGLQRFQQSYAELLKTFQVQNKPIQGNEHFIANSLREALGKQTVTVKGVSNRTHFAQVLVEADYRMKLIGIGLEQPPVRIPSFVENVKPSKVPKNALQRWYFTPDYQRILVNEDETAMQLVGDGVKLIGADERVQQNGVRVKTSRANRASRNFTREFTKKFGQLAEKSPVFAELRNLIDMSIVAAFIKEMDYYGQADWDLGILNDETKLNTETYQAPIHVEPAINALWKQRVFMTPIGGGVSIQPRNALSIDNMKVDEKGEVNEIRKSISLGHLDSGQWWWD